MRSSTEVDNLPVSIWEPDKAPETTKSPPNREVPLMAVPLEFVEPET